MAEDTREPVYTALNRAERATIEQALALSDCRSISGFLRDAALVTARHVVEQAESEKEASR